MSSTKNMLNVLMDGIKDAGMWLDYAEEAAEENKPQRAAWFKANAEQRINGLETMYKYISDEIRLTDKVRNGDEIAEALADHIECEMGKLGNRL